MRFTTVISAGIAAVALLLGTLRAEEAPGSAQVAVEEKLPVNVAVQLHVQWAKEIQRDELSAATNGGSNSFTVQRAYIDLSKKIDDVWSARLTTDVENYAVSDSSGKAATRYSFYVKYAYGQAAQKFGPVNAVLQFGVIGTPIIDLVNKVSDARWIYQSYVDRSGDVLPSSLANVSKGKGQTIDYSADLGVSLSLGITKYLTLTGEAANGDGFKNTRESDRSSATSDANGTRAHGKTYYGLATITPFEGLYLFGYYRNQQGNPANNTDFHTGGNFVTYYGGGIAYSIGLVKAGFTYSLPEAGTQTTADDATTQKFKIFDSWVNINLASVTGMPLLLYGRYARGYNEDVEELNTTIYGAGVGYRLSDNVRFIAYYDNKKVKSLNDPDSNFYIKSEIRI